MTVQKSVQYFQIKILNSNTKKECFKRLMKVKYRIFVILYITIFFNFSNSDFFIVEFIHTNYRNLSIIYL